MEGRLNESIRAITNADSYNKTPVEKCPRKIDRFTV